MVRIHIFFYGRVQGVGFRYYAVNKANELGLTGWVQNLENGSVEMEVQGELETIRQLVHFMETRRWIDIERMETKPQELKEEKSFREKGWGSFFRY